MSEFREPGFIRDIAADTKEQHRQELREVIQKIEYLYIDQLIRNGKNGGLRFSELLKDFDPQLKSDLKTISDLEHGTNDASHDTEYYDQIDAAYSSADGGSPDSAIEAVSAAIKGFYEHWQKSYPDDWRKRQERQTEFEQEKAGVLTCNICPPDRFTLEEPEVGERLRAKGFYPDDKYLEIHLPEAYLSDTKLSPQTLKQSFVDVAVRIIEKYPEVNGVVGRSWLLDRPAVRKLAGFEIVGEASPNWLQFIDEHGQINRERLAEMAETSELPYKNLVGIIHVEDFLGKFLPKERRGEIILKEIDPAWREKYGGLREKVQAEGKVFAEAWDGGKITDEAGLSAALEAMPSFASVLDSSGTRDVYLSLLTENFGKKRKIIYAENTARVDALSGRTEACFAELEKTKYREKKVVIE